MVKKYLGDTIDIHAGGRDLSFPHHENEIAQSEALTDKPMANYWMHNGFINIDNEKMSKSLGNFVLAHDIIRQHSPEVVRFFMLTAHYRSPINFSSELLEGAKNGLDRIKTALGTMKHRLNDCADYGEQDGWLDKVSELRTRFIQEMDDDFNSANGISVLFDAAKEANIYSREKQTSKAVLEAFISLFDELGGVLGLSLHEEAELLDAEVDQLIEKRNEARAARDFKLADDIRDQLKAQGILLEDTPRVYVGSEKHTHEDY